MGKTAYKKFNIDVTGGEGAFNWKITDADDKEVTASETDEVCDTAEQALEAAKEYIDDNLVEEEV
jgi:hypothetical protein